MTQTQKNTQMWDIEPCYIGDDVYHGMDIVTDIEDREGNPFVVSVQTGSATTDRQIAGQIASEHNAHSVMLDALRDVLTVLQDPKSSSVGCREETFDSKRTSEARAVIRAAISKATEQD